MWLSRVCQSISNRLGVCNAFVAEKGVLVASVFLLAMVVIVLAQVFFRYVLNDSLVWAEELAKAMMVWSAFLVAPQAMRTGANVSIEMLSDALPVRVRLFVKLIISAATLWVLTIFFQESMGLWQRGQAVTAASIPVQMSTFYTIVPVGFAALILVAIELILHDILTFIDPSLLKDPAYRHPAFNPSEHGGDGA